MLYRLFCADRICICRKRDQRTFLRNGFHGSFKTVLSKNVGLRVAWTAYAVQQMVYVYRWFRYTSPHISSGRVHLHVRYPRDRDYLPIQASVTLILTRPWLQPVGRAVLRSGLIPDLRIDRWRPCNLYPNIFDCPQFIRRLLLYSNRARNWLVLVLLSYGVNLLDCHLLLFIPIFVNSQSARCITQINSYVLTSYWRYTIDRL